MDQRKYKKGGDAGSKGVRFQVNLLTLFLFKAIRKLEDWRLSTENNEAGKFDDVVLEWPDGVVLLQAKYRDNKKTITFDELLSTNTKKDDFSLPKYFISYHQIKCRFQVKSVIVCTNASVDKKAFDFINRRKASPESMLYYEEDTCLVYTFNDNILPDLIDKTKMYLQQCRNKNIDESVITDENLRDFLEHLQFFFNYPSGEDIENINGKLLSVAKDIRDICNEISSSDVHSKIMDWFQQKDGEYLTEIRAKALFLEIKKDKYWQKLERYNVFLQNNSLNFFNTGRVFHIVADEGHLLQEIQVFRALQEIKKVLCVCPESDIEELSQTLRAFELPSYTFIVIIWPKFMEELQAKEVTSKLEQILNNYQYKKVVLVTESKSELAKQCQSTFLNHDVIKESVIWDDLKEETQKILSTKKIINFQGNIFNLDELFATDKDYGAALNSQILEKLVRGEEVTMGRKVQSLDPHIERLYIDRTFIRNDKKREEGDIFDVNEKVILIADSPGMGKSTVLANLAIVIKRKHPHLWVIRLVLSDYTRILRDFVSGNKGTLNVIDLLNSQVETRLLHQLEKFLFSVSDKVVLMLDGVDEISPTYTEVTEKLIFQCKQAHNFSKIFVTTRLHMTEKLEGKLEVKSFKLQPFTEQNQIDFLTSYWARNLELNGANKTKCEQYARALLSRMCFWVNWNDRTENQFASVPLQVRMLGEIFQERTRLEDFLDWEGCKEYLDAKGKVPKLPKKINFVKLFKMFIDKKRSIFLEKGNSTGNAKADIALNKQFDECLTHHRALALEVILDKQKCELFTIYNECKEYINTDIFDVGIVLNTNISNGTHFIHRTFAEYFFAECLLKELQCQNQNVEFQKFLIDEVLQKAEYTVVCAFFDSRLQEVVDFVPCSIFKEYQYFASITDSEREHPLYLIHNLAGNGYVGLLRLIFKCIDFRIIKGKETSFIELTSEATNITMRNIILLFETKSGIFNRITNFLRNKNNNSNTLNLLRYYVRHGGVNIRNYGGETPLDRAIDGGHLDMVKFLVEQGSNINCSRPPTQAIGVPLYRAVERGHFDIVKFLVEQGANIKVNDEWDYKVLYEAVSRNYVSIAEYLLVKILETDHIAASDSFVPYTAAYLGRLDILEDLPKTFVPVDTKIPNGMTLLFGAAQGGQLDTIRYLVQRGANINSRDRWGDTALHVISKNASLSSTAKLLIELGIDVRTKNFWRRTALHNASEEGNLDVVQFLVDGGAKVNRADGTKTPRSRMIIEGQLAKTVRGYTALHLAAEKGHLDIVKCLLEFGADVNITTNSNCTVLHSAVFSSRLDVVKLLVENGVDVNVRDHEGCTALHLAISWCQFHIVKFLLEFGTDVNLKNNNGYSVLHSAAMIGEVDTLKLLIKCGVDLNVTDAKERTALHLAVARTVIKEKFDVVKLLVDAGVNLNARDSNGYTALHFAVKVYGFKLVRLFKKLGVDTDEEGSKTMHKGPMIVQWNDHSNPNGIFHVIKCATHQSIIKYLIKCGTDINIKDSKGDSVASLIKKTDSPLLIKYLDLKLPPD